MLTPAMVESPDATRVPSWLSRLGMLGGVSFPTAFPRPTGLALRPGSRPQRHSLENRLEAATQFGAGAERIDSIEWLRDCAERYTAAWNSHDPAAVTAFMAEDVVFEDPALPEPASGQDGVAAFAVATFTALPDWQVSMTGAPAISDDGLVAYVPWRMSGTNTGPIDPPGFPPTGMSFAIEGVTRWCFRAGLIWRERDIYDGTSVSRQLGLAPSAGSRGERTLVRM